jgi:hypothetical protein
MHRISPHPHKEPDWSVLFTITSLDYEESSHICTTLWAMSGATVNNNVHLGWGKAWGCPYVGYCMQCNSTFLVDLILTIKLRCKHAVPAST